MTHMFFVAGFIGLFMALEGIYAWRENRKLYDRKDSFMNILIGVGSLLTGIVPKAAMVVAFEWAFARRMVELQSQWLEWSIAFFAVDIAYYVYHRASHKIGWLWACHAVHHSSEHFNVSTTLRLPWTNFLTGKTLFWCWIPLLGVHPLTVFVLYEFVHFYQTWIHTEAIKKMPPLVEFIFNTPSHHRVHHASNPKYLDRNHGGILIIWDRLLRTFQEEDEKPVYGLTESVKPSNAFAVIVMPYKTLFKRCAQAKSVWGLLGYLVGSPDWSETT